MAKELYVGHIPYEATNDDLRRLFSVAGTVTSVHIITDPVSGKSKGCGYVRMSNEAELQEAITCLDGALMDNMTITVSIARPQKPQPANRPGNSRRAVASRKPRAAEATSSLPPVKRDEPRKPGSPRNAAASSGKPADPRKPAATRTPTAPAKKNTYRAAQTSGASDAARKPGIKPQSGSPRKPSQGRRTPSGRS